MALIDNSMEKAKRLECPADVTGLISRRLYNVVMCLTLAWGFLVDVFLCMTVGDAIFNLNIIVLLGGYLILSIGSVMVIYKSDNPVISFIAFTVLSVAMGLLVSGIVFQYTSASVMDAFFKTIMVCLIVGLLSSIFPKFFLKLGAGLFIALLAAIIVEGLMLLFTHESPEWISFIMVAIFSSYFGYDLVKSQQYISTVDNAVDSAADIYVDVVNLFLRLLRIFGNLK